MNDVKLNTLIEYSEWLLITRVEIVPMIGDKIKYINDDYTIVDEEIHKVIDYEIYLYDDDVEPINIEDCFVKIYPTLKWYKEVIHIDLPKDYKSLVMAIWTVKLGSLNLSCMIEKYTNYAWLFYDNESFSGTLKECMNFVTKTVYNL